MIRWLLLFVASAILSAVVRGAEVSQPGEMVVYLSQHGYATLPLETSDHNRQYLNAKINGKDVHLTVDTGCSRTELNRARAAALDLDVDETRLLSFSVGGPMSGTVGQAKVKSFTLGGHEINRTPLIHILPKSAALGSTADGLFGYDYLHLNAVILPVGARYLLFKPGNGPPAEIESYMLKLGFRPTALDYGKGGLLMQSHLNGQPFNAVVDCGAPLSVFNADFVTKACRLAIHSMAFPVHGVDGRKTQGFYFTSRDLYLGTLGIAPISLTACHAPIFDYSKTDALLGYDLLAAHQAIIDFGQNVIWMR